MSNSYVTNLKKLILGETNKSGQIYDYISKEMRPQDDVVNGDRSKGKNLDRNANHRVTQLLELGPKYKETAYEGTSYLVHCDETSSTPELPINNNPNYPPNMIDRLITPFEFIEKILLQDFSKQMKLDGDDSQNYFRDLFKFKYRSGESLKLASYQNTYGIVGFTMVDGGFSQVNYDRVKEEFENGEFFLDSFTYTPFVDYATTDPKIGIYADEFLTDYNYGKYNEDYTGIDKKQQVDIHRHGQSSTMFELRNLEKDIHDAKTSFRNAVALTDSKSYIYVFCEHIAKLFAKLSNIRMCHEIYGFKHPHRRWEGILALDIWYNLLYKNIDAKYPFDVKYFNMNPMARKRVFTDESGREYVESDDVENASNGRIYKDSLPSATLEWIDDETIGDGVPDELGNLVKYAFIWNDVMWQEYNDNCLSIANTRKDCVLPRGVLTKVNDIVRRFVPLAEVTHKAGSDNDYDWFYQPGKVYQESHRSVYTKYTNLHLGCAYDVMSAFEYHELTNNDLVGNQYVKPIFGEAVKDVSDIRDKMLEQGYYALVDAFEVIKNEKIFNIYNSSTNTIEEFNPANVNDYSQSQCAIVIERVFSRLYKYLQFKSTTGEVFQRHINIDSGYKYLTTDTLKHSQNPNAFVYYDENDMYDPNGYLRYLTKVEQYWRNPGTSGLDANERNILEQFLQILAKTGQGWLLKNWDLCPLCRESDSAPKEIVVEEASSIEESEPVSAKGMLKSRAADGASVDGAALDVGYRHRDIYINFNLNSYMQWTGGVVQVPVGSSFKRDLLNRPQSIHFEAERDDFQLDLSEVQLVNKPTFTDTDETLDAASRLTVQYELVGFSTDRFARVPSIDLDDVLTKWNFHGSDTLSLYAVWNTQYIVKFRPGDGGSGEMRPITVRANELVNLPKCTFTGPSGDKLRFEYHDSPTGFWEFDSPLDSSTGLNATGERWQTHRFANWRYSIGGSYGICYDEYQFGIQQQWVDSAPIVVLEANWTLGYDILTFKVGDEPYCDVLIDKEVNTVVYPPFNPKLSDPNLKFLGWSSLEGDVLPGIEGRGGAIICDDKKEPLANTGVSEDGDNEPFDTGKNLSKYIICDEKSDVEQYQRYVTAKIHAGGETAFRVTFKYIDSDGHEAEKWQDVVQNQHIPSFHLHLETNVKDGDDSCTQYVFRYWNLVSGNITSSMTILSESILVAVYDKVVVPLNGGEQDKLDGVSSYLVDPRGQDEPNHTLETCQYWSGHPDIDRVNSEGKCYCTLIGLNPRQYDESRFDEFSACPFLSLLNRLKSSANDFMPLTMLEIVDVVNLLKALFKINIDIAHREYFLKIDVPEKSDWWYGEILGEADEALDEIICTNSGDVVCGTSSSCPVVCFNGDVKWISFEPTVEFKFSNFHTANQVEDGRLVCRIDKTRTLNWRITPVNRELIGEYNTGAVHYSDLYYYYDYRKALQSVQKRKNDTTDRNKTIDDNISTDVTPILDDQQNYYDIRPLCLYENSTIQSPVDANDFLRHRLGHNNDGTYNEIVRGQDQLQTFTSIVKKYRPIIMPKVRDIFNDCDMAADTKYQADVENRYGVFGWCTIPSKTMVNMEYNEDSIIVPSSYDKYNRIGGYNFLQMDRDFHLDVFDETQRSVYEKWVKLNPEDEDDKSGYLVDNIKSTWYYLYNQRDWTYFLIPFFNIKQNSELYSFMLDTYQTDKVPKSSDHINGIIFEQSNEGRTEDPAFGDIVRACEFLAKRHHNENNLKTLAERFTKLIPYQTLKQLTVKDGEFNGMYGTQYNFGGGGSGEFRFPYQDWVDDYDKGGSFVDLTVNKYVYDEARKVSPDKLKYKYNLSQAHAIDDFDEDSVWFYITMVSPLEDLNQVVELEDIMPYVFWWENRGEQNNGPTVDCYGRISSAKLNYEEGGYCYSNAHEKQDEYVEVDSDTKEERRTPTFLSEHRWHAVQHTIGTDFAKRDYGGTVLTTDNSGNCYKGVFDPNCAGTNEKWKIHHMSNAFGTPQHEDLTSDKYYFGEQCHGDGDFRKKQIPENMNTDVLDSIHERPMTWNLWNVVRHYAYIKYFKNKRRELGSDLAAWQALEKYTKKIVRSIYRTFKQNKWKGGVMANGRNTFGDVDGSSTNYGTPCYVHWTNSFIEISHVLERNAREHEASFVMFTGNIPHPTDEEIEARRVELIAKYTAWKKRPKEEFDEDLAHTKWHDIDYEMARASLMYERILNSHDNFRVTTLDGVDDDHDGMRPRELKVPLGDPYDQGYKAYIEDEEDDIVPEGARIYQGFKFEDVPANYIIGDSLVYQQLLSDTTVQFPKTLDLDQEFPESEYYLNDSRQKWIRKISKTVLNKQLFPVYTSMEAMNKSHHDLTVKDMKSITFQVVPQFYWRYEWSYNELFIHRVGKLLSPSTKLVMYDMLGNVWEWVRDDWNATIKKESGPGSAEGNPEVNPIVTVGEHTKKVIKGGAFDQLCRKVICSSREELAPDRFKSKYATQANVGFRPSMIFTAENEGSSFEFHTSPVDLFFLFDASASQNNQITKMIESATDIVRMFAGFSDTGTYDICHVGSALFLGPTLRFMCAHKCAEYTQIKYGSYDGAPRYYNWKRGYGSTEYHYYLAGGENAPYTHWEGGDGGPRPYGWGCAEEKKHWTNGAFGSGTGADGKPSGFETFFQNYYENCWMMGSEGSGSSAKSIDGSLVDNLESEWSYKTNVLDEWSGEYKESDIQVEYGDEEDFGFDEEIQSQEPLKSRGSDTGGSGGYSCFVAGTKVEMSDGSLKNIEDVSVGDQVVSYNEEEEKNEISEVAQTMTHDVDEDIYTFTIEGDELDVTGNHKFYIMRKDKKSWIRADEIVVGDLVMFHDRSLHRISKIASQKLSTGVFNIEVTKNHNYYVGRKHILAHNKGETDCFVAGTKVLMADGTEKDIDKIEEGELVLSYNETTGKNEYCRVVKTLRHLLVREIFTIRIGDEVIEATGVHPFYVNRGGKVSWVTAQDLLVSDMLLRPNGTWDTIDNIDIALKLGYVYNLEVSGTHTYYVGERGALVHNKGDCFVAGTKVIMLDGRKDIDKVEKGDTVLSYDEVSGKNQYCKVVKTMRHLLVREIFTIKVGEETIEATGVHPFYVNRDEKPDWVTAQDLKVSDKLLRPDGTWHTIDNIDIGLRLGYVYNLEVSGTHTYYVGEQGILVHNKKAPPPEYPKDADVTVHYYTLSKKFNLFCGVPVWIKGGTEVDGELRPMPLTFGGITKQMAGVHVDGELDVPYQDDLGDKQGTGEFGDWQRYFASYQGMTWNGARNKWTVAAQDGQEAFSKEVPFFTYDPTDEGVEDFEFPFIVSDKGVLSNWWAGCEPTCRMMSKLIRKGYFYGHPNHRGLGYLFRKKVPRLVFVFANEYDNEMDTTYTEAGGVQSKEILVSPGIPSKTQLQFYGGTSVFGKDLVPPDPYCLQMMRGNAESLKDTFETYCYNVGLNPLDSGSEEYNAMTAVQSLLDGDTGKFNEIEKEIHQLSVTVKWDAGKAVTNDLKVSGSLASADMQKETDPFDGMESTKLLTETQKSTLYETGKMPGNSTIDKKHYVSYNWLKTIGYFQLRNTMALTDQPVNSYMFVSDANAPVPLYDTGKVTADNALEVAKSFYMNNEPRLFKDMDQVVIDDDEMKGWFSKYLKSDEPLTWKTLRLSNNALQMDDSRAIDNVKCDASDASILETIFGLENPYTSTNMVFATRHGWKSFVGKKDGTWNGVTMSNDHITEVPPTPGKDDTQIAYYDKYFFIMGLPACRTLKKGDETFAPGSWRQKYHAHDGEFAGFMRNYIVQSVFPHGEGDEEGWVTSGGESDLTKAAEKYNIPNTWAEIIYNYANNGTLPEGKDGVANRRGDHTNENPKYILSAKAREFIDKHLCPLTVWGDINRRKKTEDYPFRRMGKYTLTEESIELMAVCLRKVYKKIKNETTGEWSDWTLAGSNFAGACYPMFIKKMCSALSPSVYGSGATSTSSPGQMFKRANYSPPTEIDCKYAWTKAPLDYITITYRHMEGEGEDQREVVTGHMKIIVHQENIAKTSSGLITSAAVCATNNRVLTCNPEPSQEFKTKCDDVGAYATITDAWAGPAYPPYWKFALMKLAIANSTNDKKNVGTYSEAKEIWAHEKLVNFVKKFYTDFKKALPILMGYRWQHQVFDEMTNSSGRSLTDYEDEENTVIVKSIPVMDVTGLKEVFYESFMSGSGVGNLSDGKKFSYKYAVIDLLPDLTEYNKKIDSRLSSDAAALLTLQPGKFPMKFKDSAKINTDDEFKTSKIILSRIDGISGEMYDNFVMGSHASDYDLITDPNKRKYRDAESIVDGARDDYKYVTLGNGGSYQRKYPNIPVNKKEWPSWYTSSESVRQHDFYNPDVDKSEQPWIYERNKFGDLAKGKDSSGRSPGATGYVTTYKKRAKYFRNKHFFIDPFELTIAQWCYVYGFHKNPGGTVPMTKELIEDANGKVPGETGYVTTYQLIVDASGKRPGESGYTTTYNMVPDMALMKGYARANLAKAVSNPGSIGDTNFKKMEKSYWKYVCVWENEEWKYLLETGKDRNGKVILTKDQISDLAALSPRDAGSAGGSSSSGGSSPANGYRSVPLTELEEKCVTKLVNWGIYNPLEDTRPFYYASYNAVRSSRVLYSTDSPAAAITREYIMSNNEGKSQDEFQLVEHPSTPMSFMDILNSNVVVQTQTRIYGVNKSCENAADGGPDRSVATWPEPGGANGNCYNTRWWENQLGNGLTVAGYEAKANGFANGTYDKYGGSPLMQYLMDARDNKQGLTKTTWRKKRWSSGVKGGINFDLPTEAQWEYCCRAGSAYAIPPWYNLAENFEERDDNLDLIAWYKYKVIGSLPEPERFCAWRISKMLFGISKDKEQINNVYETTY